MTLIEIMVIVICSLFVASVITVCLIKKFSKKGVQSCCGGKCASCNLCDKRKQDNSKS